MAASPAGRRTTAWLIPSSCPRRHPFGSTEELHRYFRGEYQRNEEYGRYGNPTQRVAEAKLAALEANGRSWRRGAPDSKRNERSGDGPSWPW